MRPNIFDIATKELNQDAFITWLLQFADSKYKATDELLNECGKSFVYQLIRKQLSTFDQPILKVNAGRQWENIDVWAEINDKYLIIIEDKTNTSHHSNQLTRYKTAAGEWCIKNNYEKPICIYLKTGNESQSSLNAIEDEEPNDLDSFIARHNNLKVIGFNGKKSQALFDKYFDRKKDIKYISLPSTSPANTGIDIDNICKQWQQLLIK